MLFYYVILLSDRDFDKGNKPQNGQKPYELTVKFPFKDKTR